MKPSSKEKFLNIFENTIDNTNMRYTGSYENIDYYSLMCKAASKDLLHNIENCNICMFNCLYNNSESVLIMVAIPIVLENNKDIKNKHIVERVMETVEFLESSFITLDYMYCKEVKEEKFMYLISIKKI